MEEAEEEIKRPKEEGSDDVDVKSDCGLAGRSLPEPQEEAEKDDNETEDGKTMRLESMLAEKDALIDTLNKDLGSSKASKGEAEKLLGESEKVVEHLKGEIQRQKDFERRLYDSFVTQTSQLEQAHILIDKWKSKVGSARAREGREITSNEENYWLRLQVERLENEVRIQRNGRSPWEEVKRLRKEVEMAVEAEENSKRALDDLALVIKEVAADANQAKEKLQLMKEETDTLRSESDVKEKAHRLALTEAKKENESLKATIDRLGIELKERLPSLNGEETGFVDSIKTAEMEKVNMQEEKNNLLESLNEAKDESRKISDILKQAKVEIAQLKNSLAEKDKAYIAAQMRPYSRKDIKAEEKEQKKNKKEHSSAKVIKKRGDMKGRRRSTEDFTCGAAATFCSIPLHVPGMSSKIKEVKEVRETDDGLTGSIFDIVQPASVEVQCTRSASTTTVTDDEISVHSDEFGNTDRPYGNDIEIEKESHHKRRLLRKKFSELWRRKSYSHSQTNNTNSHHSQPHNHNQDQKEVGIE